jgi:Uma2 family endonuclease
MALSSYILDLADPRAPSVEQWERMSSEERTSVVDQLPSEFPRETAPEGDLHRDPKEKALEALREYYRRLGRSVYLSAELPVYYPAERLFAPDVIAVLDVETHPRKRWVVAQEGKGLDVAIEITLEGDRRKDLEDNVLRYARLGIGEYFVVDLKFKRVLGFRLQASGSYEPIMPQFGRWTSKLLGLDLALELGRVRFYAGSAPLPFADELVSRLGAMVDDLVLKEQELARELEAAQAEAKEEKAKAKQARTKAKQEKAKAEQEKAKAEQEKAKAQQERAKAQQERAKAERLAARLRALGETVEEE